MTRESASTGEAILGVARDLGYDFTPQERALLSQSLEVFGALFAALEQLPLPEMHLPQRDADRTRRWVPAPEDDPYNAFITRCEITGAPEGRLARRTVAFKDCMAVGGVRMTLGSDMLDDYEPEFDATIVTRVLDEGATVVGKLNMEPFSGGVGTTGAAGTAGRRPFGRVRNPHDLTRSAGGSSSGSAAAVAGGLVDIAFGTDQGGSTRAPSAWCGVLGFKPTHGLVPYTGVIGHEAGADHVGVMARTTSDLAQALASVAGRDGLDPRQATVPTPPDYAAALGHGVDGLRVGVLAEGFGKVGADADVEAAVMAAVDTFTRLGARVQDVSNPLYDIAPAPLVATMLSGFAHETAFTGPLPRTFNPVSYIRAFGAARARHTGNLPVLLRVEHALAVYLRSLDHGAIPARAENLRPAIAQSYDELFATVDILVMPTVPVTAPVYREATTDEEAVALEIAGGGAELLVLASNTAPFNYTGHPALSVPCGKVGGLPVGLQVVGGFFSEERLLQVAQAFESAVDWESIVGVDRRGGAA